MLDAFSVDIVAPLPSIDGVELPFVEVFRKVGWSLVNLESFRNCRCIVRLHGNFRKLLKLHLLCICVAEVAHDVGHLVGLFVGGERCVFPAHS